MADKPRRTRAKTPIRIERSSGNVFDDLGLPDAVERLAKAELARVIRQIVQEREWTQARAAGVLGIPPSDMSDLMRGKIARFSQERLERFLIALDMDIRIQIAPRGSRKRRATVTVELLGAL